MQWRRLRAIMPRAAASIRTSFFVLVCGFAALVIGCGRNALPIGAGPDECGPGISLCYGGCTDTRWDPQNCGGCGQRCVSGQLCNDGSCVSTGTGGGGGGFGGGGGGGFGGGGGGGFGGGGGGGFGGGGGGGGCSYPSEVCNGTCTDVTSDSNNCGSCGVACGPGNMCSMSTCVLGCTAPLVSCKGVCVDTGGDPANCGGCGVSCASSQTCNGGKCASPCPTGQTFCGEACTDLGSDPANCGGCDIGCAHDQTCQAGLCRGAASVWPTLGGDVHHTGYNPAETGKPPLTLAWSISIGSVALWPAVSDGTTIYVSSQGSFSANGAILSALAPADGHNLWQYNFGNVFGIGQPTVTDGHVFIAQSNNGGETYMYSFVAADGTLFWSQPFDSQWEHYWAPVVVGGRVYADGGSYGGLYAFDEASGGELFFAYEDQWDEWSPLYFDNHVYTFTNGNLRMFDALSGALALSTTVSWIWNGYDMNTSPISDGAQLYIISPPNLVAYAPNFGRPAWTANGSYSSQPAVAAGVVYSISGGQLRANDAATGALLWSFAGDSALDHPPVVAAGTVYVASEANVYAVDVTSHAQVWSNTPGGWLSIAAGQLLVASNNGVFTAWSLTP